MLKQRQYIRKSGISLKLYNILTNPTTTSSWCTFKTTKSPSWEVVESKNYTDEGPRQDGDDYHFATATKVLFTSYWITETQTHDGSGHQNYQPDYQVMRSTKLTFEVVAAEYQM